jgi:hypothetical protein
VLGLGLGLLLIAFLEYKDKSLRTERDVWAFTKLPTLASIALVPETKGAGGLKRSLNVLRKKDAKPAGKSLANVGG